MQSFYEILNVSPTASEGEIKKAIHEKLRIWYGRTNSPDINRRQEAEQIMKSLEEAQTILLDKTKRAEYDQQLQTVVHEQPLSVEVGSGNDLLKQADELLLEGKLEDARKAALKATEKDGSNPKAWASLAWINGRLGKLEEATYELKRVVEKCPDTPGYYWSLGSVYEERGMWQEAFPNFERSAHLCEQAALSQPDDSELQRTAADQLIFVNKPERAVPLLERTLVNAPDYEYLKWRLAVAYHQTATADWVLGRMSSLFQDGIRQWFQPEELLCVSKESAERSIEYFSKALALDFEDRKLEANRPKLNLLSPGSIIIFLEFWLGYSFVNTWKKRIKKDIGKAKWSLRKHSKNPWETVVVGIVGIALTPLYGVGIVAMILWYFTGMKPGWKINREKAGLKKIR